MPGRGKFRPEVVGWEDIENNGNSDSPIDFDLFDHKVLVEGDSWVTLGGIPTSNLPYSLRFQKSTLLCNCGSPGDTIKNMAQIANNRKLRLAMSRRWSPIDWDLLFISGGGNDLFDFADDFIIDQDGSGTVKPAPDYVDPAALKKVMDDIREGFRAVGTQRNIAGSSCWRKPMVIHTYDYATARNSPARFFTWPVAGPWFFKHFNKNKVPETSWEALADYLTDQLVETLLKLDQSRPGGIPNCHVVDTRNQLVRASKGATGDSGDWMNEIHPNPKGYEKIAKAVEPTIYGLL